MKHTILSAAFIVVALGASASGLEFQTSVDPGGCLLEHVAVKEGINQFHHDGLSADGQMLVVGWDRGEEERGAYLLNLASGERTDLPHLNNVAVFSPDGKTLLAAIYVDNGKTDIVELDLETNELSVIAEHEQWDWLASYSSDGEVILFNSYRTGASDIYTYDKTSEELKQWTDYDGYEAHAQFSPDDSKILFHRREGEDFNLFMIDVASGDVTRLTDDATEESYGSWSPDGKHIVFSSDRNRTPGVLDLYLMNLKDSKVRQLTDIDAKDRYPFFSPDGKYVYFNSDRKPRGLYRLTLNDSLDCVKHN